MSKRENDEPPDAGCCKAVRIGQYGNESELKIFYTPEKGLCCSCRASRASHKLEQGSSSSLNKSTCLWNRYFAWTGFEVHNGFLAGKRRRQTEDGRWFWDLIVVTSKDGIINVRRYDDEKSGESEFLMNVLTVFNEQCLRMYISLTEFVKMATTE